MEDPLQEVRAVLIATPDRWLGLTAAHSAAALERTPAPGEWSAAECLGHLIQTERDVFPRRVRSFLAGEDIAGFAPATAAGGSARPSLPELAAEFARLRAQNLESDRGHQAGRPGANRRA